jgi:fructokinase
MNAGQYTIVGLGELLWDLLPTGRQLGGAPANFAYHAAMLGNRGIVASRLGNDELGREALHRLRQLGLATSYVQLDASHPTGTVLVELDEKGKPDFTITEDVAWDFLEWTESWQELASQADAVCFGSLAQRSPQSQKAIRQFLQATRKGDLRIAPTLRVFDVNLRQAFYSAEVLSESLKLSDVVKLNDDELSMVMDILKLGDGNQESCAPRLVEAYNLKLVCVTRGAKGSLLATDTKVVEHPGFQVTVADTVGAGDAFTAALAHYYLRNANLEKISEAANRLGAWVATQVGATPSVNPDDLNQIIGDIG